MIKFEDSLLNAKRIGKYIILSEEDFDWYTGEEIEDLLKSKKRKKVKKDDNILLQLNEKFIQQQRRKRLLNEMGISTEDKVKTLNDYRAKKIHEAFSKRPQRTEIREWERIHDGKVYDIYVPKHYEQVYFINL